MLRGEMGEQMEERTRMPPFRDVVAFLVSAYNCRNCSTAWSDSENRWSVLNSETISDRDSKEGLIFGLSARARSGQTGKGKKSVEFFSKKKGGKGKLKGQVYGGLGETDSSAFSSSSNKILSAVPTPETWSLPQRRHLSHPTQSMIMDTLRNLSLNSCLISCRKRPTMRV